MVSRWLVGLAALASASGCRQLLGIDSPSLGDAGNSDSERTSADAEPDAPATPFLVGVLMQPALVTDLTDEGTLDWAEWGATSASDFEHKASGNGQIANLSVIAGGTPTGYGNAYNMPGLDGFTWSDGMPTANQPVAQYSGLYLAGDHDGFATSAPADLHAVHVLAVYVGAYMTTGELTAHLSDSSAADYVDSMLGDPSASVAGVYTLSYRAASDGQTLSIHWIQIANNGDVNVSAATLR